MRVIKKQQEKTGRWKNKKKKEKKKEKTPTPLLPSVRPAAGGGEGRLGAGAWQRRGPRRGEARRGPSEPPHGGRAGNGRGRGGKGEAEPGSRPPPRPGPARRGGESRCRPSPPPPLLHLSSALSLSPPYKSKMSAIFSGRCRRRPGRGCAAPPPRGGRGGGCSGGGEGGAVTLMQ